MTDRGQFENFLAAELARLRAAEQERSLETPAGINLCSNDYLALSSRAELGEAVVEAIAAGARVAATGSRLLSGHAREWEELEEEFAEFAGAEAALFFTSGYAANVGLINALAGKSDTIFSDALNHASLIDGVRLSGARRFIYAHGDAGALEAALRANEANAARKFIVTESVFSMDGDFAPLVEICALAERHGASVIVDEAHAVGVFGSQGRGRIAELELGERVAAAVYPCGKALASAGAFVCGSAALKRVLINCARTFIFNTALPPYFAAQIVCALRLTRGADSARAHLMSMAGGFREELRAAGVNIGGSASQIVPVILGGNAAAIRCAERLATVGFAVRAIRPPTVPERTARLRISLTCALKFEDLQRLANELNSIGAGMREIRESAGVAGG